MRKSAKQQVEEIEESLMVAGATIDSVLLLLILL